MAKPEPNKLRMPDANDLAELRREFQLDHEAFAALTGALAEAAARWPKPAGALKPAKFKAGLRKADRLMRKVEQGLSSQDVVAALTQLEAYGQMGLLISSMAALEIDKNEDEIPHEVLDEFLARKKFRREPIRASDLDALMLTSRQRWLNDRSADAMRFAVRAMRQPIRAELLQARQDRGGARTRCGRELLIFLLARDATKIIGRRATAAANGPFQRLCKSVFDCCGIDDTGIEDAVERCLEKHARWLEWNALPKYTFQMGEPRGDDAGDIEPPLRSKVQP